MRDMVLILNYDNTGSRLIARALRAEHIYCRIVPPDITRQQAEEMQPMGLILSGSVSGAFISAPDAGLTDGTWPVLALGDAAASLCRALGGDAQETVICGSIGAVSFTPCPLTGGMEPSCERMLRNVRRLRLPDCARPLAVSREENVGWMHRDLPIFGMQFSLEPNDTDGMQLLLNFAQIVCGCSRWWSPDSFIDQTVTDLMQQVGRGRALCAVTGGLNSSVTALLAKRALGDRLQCIFIDTGLMRENEGMEFLACCRDRLGLNITHVQAQERFLSGLQGVTDPAEKSRIIARTLQSTLDDTMRDLGKFDIILRSTTCNDILNGKGKDTHPGLRGSMPTLEPLTELFKDEVRAVGEKLGLPENMLWRQSFPGSGLALRIMGEVTPARLQSLRTADQIFAAETDASGLARRLRQYFAVLMPIPGNEARAVIILRAVQHGEAGQKAYAARLPYDMIERVTESILRQRPEVDRVVYDLSPATGIKNIEWQ